MADVNVEFGAKDTGLEATLKTVQEQMTKLEAEVKSGTLSFEDLAKKMRELQQAERMAEKFSQLGGQVKQSGEEAKQTEQKISALSEILGQTATSAMSLDARIASVQMKLAELRDKTTSADLSMEELEDTLRKISTLESAERRLKGIGDASQESKPKVDSLGDATKTASDKADGAAGIFDASFQKIAGAFTVGNLAAMGFEKAIDLAFSAARAVVDAFGQALDLGGRLNDLSARTGETAGKLLVLERAFRDSGLSADQVGLAINKLQNFMAEAQAGGEAQAQAMQRLGISMADLAGKTPTQQMQVFAQAISAIEDPTQRAAIAGDVFGEKLGGRLLPLLTQFSPALDSAGIKVGSLADVMDQNAAIFDKAGETMDATRAKLTAFAAGILSETVPAVQELGNSLEMVDAAGLGEKIGATLAPILRGITQDIKILNEFISSLGQGIRSLIEPITGTAKKFDELAQKIGKVAKIVDVLIPNQLSPMGVALNGITDATGKLAYKQTEAGAAIEQTGNQAAMATPKLQEMSQSANNLPAAFESTLPLVGEFNAQLDQSTPAIEGVRNQSSLLKDDFSQIIALSAQLPSQFNEQTQSIGGVTEQLQLQKDLYGLITPQVEEVKQDILQTEKNINNATGNIKEFKSFVDLIADSQPDEPIKSLSQKTADARKEIEAFGQYIGEDLAGMSMPDIAKKLGIDTLGMDGSEQIDAIVDHIQKQLPKAKEGIVDEKKSLDAVTETAKKAGEELKKVLDYSIQTTEGGKALGSIEGIVKTISEIVAVIRDRLPQQALA